MDYQSQFLQLDNILYKYQWLWRYQPFKDQTLIWPTSYSNSTSIPAFYNALLALNDGELDTLQCPVALHHWAIDYIPELDTLTNLIELLDQPSSIDLKNTASNNEQLIRGIPQRKLKQIQRFSYIASKKNHLKEWTDWCSGKGHLAKHLNHLSDYPVTCIEIDKNLCQQGQDWADKNEKAIRFFQYDMLALTKDDLTDIDIGHSHHCALHACGDLHIRFLEQAVENQWTQLSLAPCCYQKTSTAIYSPLSRLAQKSQLKLSKLDLALAVQETATAKQRETNQRIALNEFRLGFDELQRAINNSEDYLPLPSTSVTWLNKGFDAFCRSMAELKAVVLPNKVYFDLYLKKGQERYEKVRRLELAGQCFRRPLELWLLLDRALYLEQNGYHVELDCFCHREVSARNLFIHARQDST